VRDPGEPAHDGVHPGDVPLGEHGGERAGVGAHHVDVRVAVGEQLRPPRVPFDGDVATPAAQAVLDRGRERAGARPELDDHRIAGHGQRGHHRGGERGRAGGDGSGVQGVAGELPEEPGRVRHGRDARRRR
jgi:hypothetical protein